MARNYDKHVSSPASTAMAVPFRVDTEYDRECASDGVSRFGSYVRIRLNTAFAECWEDPEDDLSLRRASFAAAAWRTATGPVKAPGYVRYKSRVLPAQVERSQWDGSLIAAGYPMAPRPAALACSFDWQGGRRWRDWPTEPRGEGYDFVDPTERDVSESPFLQVGLQLPFPVPAGRLPTPPASDQTKYSSGGTARAAACSMWGKRSRSYSNPAKGGWK